MNALFRGGEIADIEGALQKNGPLGEAYEVEITPTGEIQVSYFLGHVLADGGAEVSDVVEDFSIGDIEGVIIVEDDGQVEYHDVVCHFIAEAGGAVDGVASLAGEAEVGSHITGLAGGIAFP